jgi:hypothetical protein
MGKLFHSGPDSGTLQMTETWSTRKFAGSVGSFAQRYVKRHVPVRERAETRRLRWFLSPDFKAVFWDDRRRDPEPSVGHVALRGQVDVFPKPWNWERRNMNRLSGGKPRELCSSTVS